MKLDALQEKLVTLLTAAFPAELVVASPTTKVADGAQNGDDSPREAEKRMETALATRGVCFALSPLMQGRQVNGAVGRSASIRAYNYVLIRTNPQVNGNGTTGAGVEPVATMRTAITAVLAYQETGNRRFALSEDEDCIELVPDSKDAGLLCWQLTFTYIVQV
jgi:hypothetical protein